MEMMSITMIEKALPKEFRYMASALKDGIDKDYLTSLIAGHLDKPKTDPQVEVARMNIAGSLRAMGYVVTGGRAGGNVYQVVGWKEPEKKVTVQEWTGPKRVAYDWIQSLDPVREDDYQKFKTLAFNRKETRHSNSWLYLWAYEIADQKGFWFHLPFGSRGVIVQRHKDLPKFKIFCVDFMVRDNWWPIIDACLLASASTSSTSIVNPTNDLVHSMTCGHNPSVSVAYRLEAIYDTRDIGTNPDHYLNERAMTTLRAREKDTSFYQVPWDDEEGVAEAVHIIDTWRVYCEARHRQLAIRRDYIAAQSPYPNKIMYGGQRDGSPVLHHLFDPLVGRNHDYVMLCNEKSLNYSSAPGGKYGISDFSLVMASRSLSSLGYNYIQSGDIMGGGVGLEPKKRKYALSIYKSPLITVKGEGNENKE